MTPQIKQRIEQIRRGEVPEGYKRTKAGVVPIEWEEVRIGDVLTQRKTLQCVSEDAPLLSFTIEEGVIDPADKKSNKRDFLIKDMATKKFALTEVGDIIYNPANLKFGAIHRNNLCRGVVSPIYGIFYGEQDSVFMGYLLHNQRFIDYAKVYTEGTVEKLKTLKADTFLKLKITLPLLTEQKKIAEILFAQDKLIALKEKLIEEKKRQKISIADKLFSPEYIKQKSPLANKTSFAQICSVVTDYVSNGSFKSLKDNVEYLEQGYAVLLRLADYNNGFDKNRFIYVNEKAFNFLSRSIVYPNDIIIANVGSVGAVFRAPDLKMPMSLAPNTILVRTNISNDYFYHFVCSTRGQDLLKTITSTTAQPKFNKTDFKGLEMLVPNVDTQKNTSQILNLVDKEIEILKKDLDQEKQKKKALMQLLLTGIVRV